MGIAMRRSKRDVHELIGNLLSTAIEFGILEPGDKVAVQEGNSSYWADWHVYVKRPAPHGLIMLELPGVDLHGCCSASEAYTNLHAALRMLTAVGVILGKERDA
jgi:hypothetical protein